MKHHVALYGDSITEQGYTSSWVSRVASYYGRRADVYNRGLSGYNTTWLLQVMQDPAYRDVMFPPQVVPAAATAEDGGDLAKDNKVLLVTIFFGANDANKPGTEQHVPIDTFKSNIAQIVDMVRLTLRPQLVVLITPPPVEETKYLAHVRRNVDPTATEPFRTLNRSRQYRNAVLEVAESKATSVVDVFTVLMGAGHEDDAYEVGQPWGAFFDDGLHLNTLGGSALGEAVIGVASKSSQVALEEVVYAVPRWTALTSAS